MDLQRERKCYNCKKKFIPAPMHIYRKHNKWFCKWTCYNAYVTAKEKESESNKKKRGKRK